MEEKLFYLPMIPNIPYIFRRWNDLITQWAQHQLGVMIICLSLFAGFSILYFPNVIQKRMDNSWTSNDKYMIDFVNRKIEHPLVAMVDKDSREHYAKRELRITPYLIGKVFHLNAIRLFYLQVLLLPFFLFLFFNLIRKLTGGDAPMAFWTTACILFTYVGHSFVYDTLFYDSYAFVFLLIACYYYDRIWSVVALILAFFVDERSLFPALNLPLLFLFQSGISQGKWSEVIRDFLWKNKATQYLLLSYILYAFIRFYLYIYFHLETPMGKQAGVQLGFAFLHGYKLPYALFSALKWAIILPVIALGYFVKQGIWTTTWFYFSTYLASFIAATAVDDVTRSLTFCFPIIFVLFQIIHRLKEHENARVLISLLFLANILTPTYTLLMHLERISPFNWIY
ncbi:hypothetical protein EWU23_09700 [Cytophagaceae bacterium 50C-KIRBA]|uniref:Glycosyltransferase RgtA/B/C/D-like domain-containing protein n=1 Tax=Aquirufa beregesia TaxID=2516556 RepID=A0ABX0EZQ0_9BACT|nr:hypothetical protein [Aquirufa beregesia]NGZ44751.1 hypothetical protein [Aquirufa beregesia]